VNSDPFFRLQGKVVQHLVTKYGAKLQSGERDEDFGFLKRANRLVLAVRL
jgi:hypothetical protein